MFASNAYLYSAPVSVCPNPVSIPLANKLLQSGVCITSIGNNNNSNGGSALVCSCDFCRIEQNNLLLGPNQLENSTENPENFWNGESMNSVSRSSIESQGFEDWITYPMYTEQNPMTVTNNYYSDPVTHEGTAGRDLEERIGNVTWGGEELENPREEFVFVTGGVEEGVKVERLEENEQMEQRMEENEQNDHEEDDERQQEKENDDEWKAEEAQGCPQTGEILLDQNFNEQWKQFRMNSWLHDFFDEESDEGFCAPDEYRAQESTNYHPLHFGSGEVQGAEEEKEEIQVIWMSEGSRDPNSKNVKEETDQVRYMDNDCPEAWKDNSKIRDTSGKAFKITPARETYPKLHHCPICLVQAFPKEQGLRKHLKNHENPFKCILCNMQFSLKDSLKSHIQNEHSAEWSNKNKKKMRLYGCSLCGYKGLFPNRIQTHLLIHTKTLPFKCTDCSFAYRWKEDLRRHLLKTHHCLLPKKGVPAEREFQSFRCLLCQFHCVNLDSLIQHYFQCHPEPERQFLTHLVRPSPDAATAPEPPLLVPKIFHCTHCQFVTSQQSQLALHYASHNLPRVTLLPVITLVC